MLILSLILLTTPILGCKYFNYDGSYVECDYGNNRRIDVRIFANRQTGKSDESE